MHRFQGGSLSGAREDGSVAVCVRRGSLDGANQEIRLSEAIPNMTWIFRDALTVQMFDWHVDLCVENGRNNEETCTLDALVADNNSFQGYYVSIILWWLRYGCDRANSVHIIVLFHQFIAFDSGEEFPSIVQVLQHTDGRPCIRLGHRAVTNCLPVQRLYQWREHTSSSTLPNINISHAILCFHLLEDSGSPHCDGGHEGMRISLVCGTCHTGNTSCFTSDAAPAPKPSISGWALSGLNVHTSACSMGTPRMLSATSIRGHMLPPAHPPQGHCRTFPECSILGKPDS